MEETRAALKYILQNRKEYSDKHRSTERSRDEFEEQVGSYIYMQTCHRVLVLRGMRSVYTN